ncbi:16371_t:CDS:2 [Acaulospora morrowiae]|uniref:16371_t:CDS:1 n=1 Tax=Acaulospora morrowiae TaxID=94023 RepID=A0A9N8Z1D3_9GLOM|nr:16371_t:CDS:2 [Acaulospora morrowiae]
MSQDNQGTNNPLDPEVLLSTLESIQLTNAKQETLETVQLRSGQDALAAMFHTIMHSLGFRLVGLGERDEPGDNINRDSEGNIIGLPETWNLHGPQLYAFRYKHNQSSITFLIKCISLGNNFMVHAMGIEENEETSIKPTSLELVTRDYTPVSAFPYIVNNQNSEQLVNIFISKNRIKDLVSLYKINIVQKLIPNLFKPGYEETSATTTSRYNDRYPQHDTNDPLRIPLRRPQHFQPPIFGDPYGGDEPLNYNPLSVGRNDLDPLGSNPILGPPRFGGGGIQPFGGPSRGGGSIMGPDHPIFDPRVPDRNSGGIRGGPQFLPSGAVPPGARYDPVGPFGPLSGRGGGRFPSGEPNNDELPPPGYNDMFM